MAGKKNKIKEPKISANSLEIARKRYLRTDMKGKILETPGELFWRVARHMAKAEIEWNGNGGVEKAAETFFERMVNWKFVCSGKAMFEAGNPGGTGQMSACFVLGIEDSIRSIFKTLGDAAYVHKNNGGTGFNFSKIRPRGDKVKNVPGAASGPVDFLQAYSAALAKILQGAKRQGGNMAILNVDHPDIGDFIRVKADHGNIKNFNISVGATNEFMEAVEQGKMWRLVNPRDGSVWKKVKASKLFHEICEHAWRTGDPGMVFLDRMEEDNPTPTLGRLDATNPCGEQPLLPYESCNLTSIVLSRHVREGKIDWDDLAYTVKIAVRFLDNMIEVNTYQFPEIENIVKHGNRKIGLGVMGFAHLLYKLGVPYDSNEGVRLAERVAKFIKKNAEEASFDLAKTRGVFPNWDISYFAGTAERYRNATLLTIAPTGTISLLANCSSGIEPVFALVLVRKTFFEDDRENRPTKTQIWVDPVFEEISKREGFYSRKLMERVAEGTPLAEIDVVPRRWRRVFVTSHEIAPKWHIKIQAVWQKYCDNAVSKTINFSNQATVNDVKEAYLTAWKLKCKGITIYRDGSKEHQVLSAHKGGRQAAAADKKGASPKHSSWRSGGASCPECGAGMVFEDGCAHCKDCGFEYCKS
jgi:ribonucleoside-diphosphate reductase alpha chain